MKFAARVATVGFVRVFFKPFDYDLIEAFIAEELQRLELAAA